MIAEIDDARCLFKGASPAAAKAIGEACSWMVAGAKWSEAYKSKQWDGLVHLHKKTADGIAVPIGLMRDCMIAARSAGDRVEVTDLRSAPRVQAFGWNPKIVLRDHQAEAIAAIDKPGIHRGIGTIKMPIRSGKTICGAAVIRALACPSLFVVPTRELARQALRDLGECLQEEIGIIGEGEWLERRCTVAIAGSLAAARRTGRKEWKKMRGKWGLAIVDEVHHMCGGAWTAAVEALRCRYRIGLSATAYFELGSEVERGILRARALCGGIVHDISISRMVEAGYLIAPDVTIHEVAIPGIDKLPWGATLQTRGLQAAARNRIIVREAGRIAARGGRCIVVCSRLDHVANLGRLMSAAGIPHSELVGPTADADRIAARRDLVSGARPIAISTVLGEGVNLPEVDAVIVADGGKDPKAVTQKMRCLTPAPGKLAAEVHDFLDVGNKYLLRHSEARVDAYRSEPSFRVRVIQEK